MSTSTLTLITSAQSGVERGAVDRAIAAGIPYMGAVTRNGWAEDATTKPGVLASYPELMELSTTHLPTKTDHNIQLADLVIILPNAAHLQLREHAVVLETAVQRNAPVLTTNDFSIITNTVRQLLTTNASPKIFITGPRASIDAEGYARGAAACSVIHNITTQMTSQL